MLGAAYALALGCSTSSVRAPGARAPRATMEQGKSGRGPEGAGSCGLARPEVRAVDFVPLAGAAPLRVGERSWVVGTRGDGSGALGALGDDGALALTALPLRPTAVTADGASLWALSSTPGATRWVRVDVTDGAAPRVDAVEALPALPSHGVVTAFAREGTHALLLLAGRTLLAWDVARARPAGEPSPRGAFYELVRMFCDERGCAALGVTGDGPARRVAVSRVGADGRIEHEELSDDPVAEAAAVPVRDGVLALWTSYRERAVLARALDRSGAVVTERYTLSTLSATSTAGTAGATQPVALAPFGDGAQAWLAFRASEGAWSVARLTHGERALEPALPVPLTHAHALAAEPFGEGLVLAGSVSATRYEAGVESFSASAQALYLAAEGTTAARPLPLVERAMGPGRGGYLALPLVGPGRAAVLTAPWGSALGGATRLVTLRAPCAHE